MKKRIIGIISVLIVLVIAIAVGVIIFNNSKNTQTGHSEKNKEIISDVPEEDENKTSVENAEEVQAETTIATFDESTAVSAWTTSNLNLREQPNGSGTIITVISKGTEIKKGTEENGGRK